MGKTRRGLASKIVAIADRFGLPLSAILASGENHEVTLVERTLEQRFTKKKPQRLIADRAYDSSTLEKSLQKKGIQLIAPVRRKNKTRHQDGRHLRRYRRRWKIERLFAWLLRFRRISTRFDRIAQHYLGFVHLGCIVILLRHL